MTICEKCTNKICEQTGKACKELNKALRSEGIYSEEYPRLRAPTKIIIRESSLPLGKILEGHLYKIKPHKKSKQFKMLEKQLNDAIGKLTEREQDILNRFYWMGQGYKEIGRELNISWRYVKRKLNSIRQKLRQEVTQNAI